MTEIIHARPERFFADRFNVTPGLMDRLLGSALRGRVEDADVYLEYRINEELVIEESTIKKASRHVSQGAGVRAQAGTRTGYAHTDDISLPNLEEAARQARAIADSPNLRALRTDTDKIRALYRMLHQRDPDRAELALAQKFLDQIQTAPSPSPTPAAWQFGFGSVDSQSGRLESFQPMTAFTKDRATPTEQYPHSDRFGHLGVTADGVRCDSIELVDAA